MHLAYALKHAQVTVGVADVGLGTGNVRGEPFAMLDRDELILATMPDLYGHLHIQQIEAPIKTHRG